MREVKYRHTDPYSMYELCTALNANDLTLTYTDGDGATKTFATETQVKDVFKRFYDRLVLLEGDTELTNAQKRTAFLELYNAWWSRRKDQFGRLMDALNLVYDPISNYDRHEEGAIIDTHDIGARSGTDNLTDNYAATQHTKTETPGVSDTLTDTYGATKETVTETPRAETTTTSTPGVKTTTTTTPGVVTTTTTTPGVITTNETFAFGDNSSTGVPSGKTINTPDATTPDVVTVTPDATNPDVVTVEYDSTNPDVVTVAGTNGTNTTVTEEIQKIDSHVTTHTGQNTTTDADIARIDTHNRTTGAQAAKDTDTRSFDEYRVWGNIGVTTSAQMLTGELELRGALDLITHAVVEFIDLVSVYC